MTSVPSPTFDSGDLPRPLTRGGGVQKWIPVEKFQHLNFCTERNRCSEIDDIHGPLLVVYERDEMIFHFTPMTVHPSNFFQSLRREWGTISKGRRGRRQPDKHVNKRSPRKLLETALNVECEVDHSRVRSFVRSLIHLSRPFSHPHPMHECTTELRPHLWMSTSTSTTTAAAAAAAPTSA